MQRSAMARKLDGCEASNEASLTDRLYAEKVGLVIMFWAEDKSMIEFYGAVEGTAEPGDLYFKNGRLLESNEPGAFKIESVADDFGIPPYYFDTELPYAPFYIYSPDDPDGPDSVGIVFDFASIGGGSG